MKLGPDVGANSPDLSWDQEIDNRLPTTIPTLVVYFFLQEQILLEFARFSQPVVV